MLFGRGADGLKDLSLVGTWEKDREKDIHYTLEEVRAVAEEARMLGLKVTAHAEGLEGVKITVEAGVDTIEHGDVLDEQPQTQTTQNPLNAFNNLEMPPPNAKTCSKTPKTAHIQQ